jgi:hypothetical protein
MVSPIVATLISRRVGSYWTKGQCHGHDGLISFLTPSGSDPTILRAALRELDDEPSARAIELKGQQVDAVGPPASEVRERSLKPAGSELGDDGLLQNAIHDRPGIDPVLGRISGVKDSPLTE